MTNKKFIVALRKAKISAMENHKYDDCIWGACRFVGIQLGWNAKFGEGTEYHSRSARWVRETRPTKADIARVFDLSIAALEEK